MEIEILLENHLNHSQQYQSLMQKLIDQSQTCIQRVSLSQTSQSPEQLKEITEKCNKKINHFNAYFELYKKQYIEKGQEICLNQLEEITLNTKDVENKEKFRKNIASTLEKHKDCILFYSKSNNIFEENVNDKLKSLVDGLAFTEL